MILIRVKPTSKTMLNYYKRRGLDMDTSLPNPFNSNAMYEHYLRRNYILTANPAAQNWKECISVPIPKLVIMCGIPTAGKSTFTKKVLEPAGFKVVSRDRIRLKLFGKNYKHTKENEQLVTAEFDSQLTEHILFKRDIVLDNTHGRDAYIKAALLRFNKTNYEIHIKFFDIPLWKAYIRNVKRYLETGVWIPTKVLKQFYKNYKKIDKRDYEQYEWKN
jgi:predicted kinase